MRKTQICIKRIFDFIFSFILVIFLIPFLIVIGVMIKLDSKGPVFFIQERVGKNKKLFNIIKFRTMVPNAVNMGKGYLTEENDPRITKIGYFLRKWSIDEIPQIFNVLKGDMSLVGPRPTLKYQVEQYDNLQLRRLEMKPGITGWAQINGRNNLTWPERIKLDIWYVDNYSILLDLKIILKTVFVVFGKRGLYGSEDKFDIKNDSGVDL